MKVVFLDRDGTIVREPPDEQIDSLDKLEFIPGAIGGLKSLVDRGYELVLVTNQDGLGSPSYPRSAYETVQQAIVRLLEGEGIRFRQVFLCPHLPADHCSCRKPKTGLVERLLASGEVEMTKSFVLGDRETDVVFARNIGCRSVRLTADAASKADFRADTFTEACRYILMHDRTGRVGRSTSETDIEVEVTLDGRGVSGINTGIGFFDHMLEQLARHSMIDMDVKVNGDLRVDEHHTVEDTGMVLGEAIRQALGYKRGIRRYGFVLPMDESLAHVALDLGGRPFLKFECPFARERVGELPTELVEDFFRAFADGLRANLHITATGRNDHHKVEAIFKAVARALRDGVALDGRSSGTLPSTKGML